MGQSKQNGDWWLDTAAPHGHYRQIFPYVSLEWITRADAMTNIILIKETLWVLCTNQQDAAKTHRYLFLNQMAANAKADTKTLVNDPKYQGSGISIQQMFLMLAATFRNLYKEMTLMLAPRLQVFNRYVQKP